MTEKVFVTERQYEILKAVADLAEADAKTLSNLLKTEPEDLMRDIAELASKKLVEVETRTVTVYELTDYGRRYLERGLPEEVALRFYRSCLGKTASEFVKCLSNKSGLDSEDSNIAFQVLVKNKCIKVENGIVKIDDETRCVEIAEESAYVRISLRKIEQGDTQIDLLDLLRKRKMVSARKKSLIIVKGSSNLKRLLESDVILPKKLLTVVLPEHSNRFEEYVIKRFDLSIPPPRLKPSLYHPFMDFIRQLREILIFMGFEEVRGPHVEAELWNFDVLFQAQDHPAREIHDTFYVANKIVGDLPKDLVERVGAVHEKGWRYKWDPSRAFRLVLRTQCTAVSARTIYSRGGGEYRAFTIDRVFRPENLDAKHSMEFYQLDGIIVGKDVNFKHLLYFFKEFAAALGIKEVWFKPGYFPFTEPSVEGYIKHPRLGWVEVFPGGVFRPEVMEMLGAKGYKAIAWGIGVDRLAMWYLGIDDIRLLFSKDIEFLRSVKRRPLPFYYSKTSGSSVVVKPIPD
ncbi:phenylalanine--tRNA ligase subunit alpha [Thermogladius sp. 4427co]|uniref:phenylalanine--tRNA ligase subunit alpha n=1 Tax=Thermogladius sp. 4427co TaxID=3450718 RepID=UPI003F7A1D20